MAFIYNAILAMRINELQLQATIGENLTRMMFNKRNQMEWNIYHNPSIILKFKSRQPIYGGESQISGYYWGKGTCGHLRNACQVPFLDLNDRYTLSKFIRLHKYRWCFFPHVYFTSVNTFLKNVYDMRKLWGMTEMCYVSTSVVITKS